MSDATPNPRRLRVLTYNVQHGEGTDGRIDLTRTAAVIRAATPDVVALQELDRCTMRSGGADELAELGALTSLHAEFAEAMPYAGGSYGVGILTRHRPEQVHALALPHSPEREPRVVLWIRFCLDNGSQPVLFGATHFDYLPEPTDRVLQAEAVCAAPVSTDSVPAILAGDLNAEPDSRPLAVLGQVWQDAAGTARAGPTWPSPAPVSRIDYILYRPASRWRVVERTVVDDAAASDHRPVLAVLELS